MTNFIEFTKTRKEQIDHLRNRLMTEKPDTDVYGTKHKALGLADYVVYAALRGADYRKGDHTGGKRAHEAITRVIDNIVYWGTSTSKFGQALRKKYVPEGQTTDQLMELKAALEAERDKWKDA